MKIPKQIMVWAIILLLSLPAIVQGQVVSQPSSGDENFLVQFEQAVESAKLSLEALEKELADEKKLFEEEFRQQQIYKTQINSLRNFLVVPEIRISLLEKSIDEVDLSLPLIQSKIQKIQEKEDSTRQRLSQAKEKIALIDQSITEFGASQPRTMAREPGIKEFKTYRGIKEKQEKLLLDITDLLAREIKVNTELLNAFQDIKTILRKEIKDKKGGLLFQRNDLELKTLFSQALKKDIVLSFTTLRKLFAVEQLSLKGSLFKEHMNLKSAMIILGFMMVSFFLYKGVSQVRHKEAYQSLVCKRTGYPLIVLEKSLNLIFWILLVFTLSKTQVYIIFPDFIKFLKTFLFVILMTRIVSESLRLITEEKSPVFFNALYQWKNGFVRGIILYSFVYLLVYRFLSLDTLILVYIRIVSEVVLVVGVFLFWKAYEKMGTQITTMGLKALRLWSTVLVISGLFLDIAGYGSFAAFWYISWGLSIVVACVCVLLMYSIQDIDLKFKEKIESDSQSSSRISYPFYRVLSNGISFLIVGIGMTGIIFAWGISEPLSVWVMDMFNRKYMLGTLELSLSGFFYAIVVILLTLGFTRLWKRFMADHALKGSGLSTGAKETVITISVYIIWSVGILISLSVFGLNTTSLAVAFGALSIGLGFGLQNIANNFVSGLILLFERPIQVGDVVEVGGIWGEVKKINVRATLVQTYNNSSLIIPNSEFISTTVTNWSHRDPYIRRDLLVGVAYGSDTELVKTLLLQAADTVSEVRHSPKKPSVQFINFGDSSLDFRLRFWSTIDDFIEAESKLRFNIDRLFRENQVVIPFPQRDLHIYNQ